MKFKFWEGKLVDLYGCISAPASPLW